MRPRSSPVKYFFIKRKLRGVGRPVRDMNLSGQTIANFSLRKAAVGQIRAENSTRITRKRAMGCPERRPDDRLRRHRSDLSSKQASCSTASTCKRRGSPLVNLIELTNAIVDKLVLIPDLVAALAGDTANIIPYIDENPNLNSVSLALYKQKPGSVMVIWQETLLTQGDMEAWMHQFVIFVRAVRGASLWT